MPWRRRAAPGSDPEPDPVSPELLAWAEALDTSQLSDRTVKQAERFLRDYRHMTNLGARRESALRLRSVIEAQVSPSPPATVASMDVIAAALSARRRQLGIG
jgi:hypothetical protein